MGSKGTSCREGEGEREGGREGGRAAVNVQRKDLSNQDTIGSSTLHFQSTSRKPKKFASGLVTMWVQSPARTLFALGGMASFLAQIHSSRQRPIPLLGNLIPK